MDKDRPVLHAKQPATASGSCRIYTQALNSSNTRREEHELLQHGGCFGCREVRSIHAISIRFENASVITVLLSAVTTLSAGHRSELSLIDRLLIELGQAYREPLYWADKAQS